MSDRDIRALAADGDWGPRCGRMADGLVGLKGLSRVALCKEQSDLSSSLRTTQLCCEHLCGVLHGCGVQD